MSHIAVKILSMVLITSLCLSTSAVAQVSDSQTRLRFSDIITGIPNTTVETFSMSFNKKAVPAWAGILSSTALLFYYDEEIITEGQKLGSRWGLSNNDKTKTVVEVGPYNILRLPTDAASSLYFLGDGWLHGSIAAGFLATGYLSNSTRPINTGIELVHGMAVSTLFSQLLKRAFGRESPNQSTATRGRWRPFPSIKAYNERTAEYDAMPSGHVMTATLTFTIIRGNYPEYDNILLPVEVAWLTALGFGMVNNGVHWASDYPLGIAMGYVFGKASLMLPNTKKANESNTSTSHFYPAIADGTVTANWLKRF